MSFTKERGEQHLNFLALNQLFLVAQENIYIGTNLQDGQGLNIVQCKCHEYFLSDVEVQFEVLIECQLLEKLVASGYVPGDFVEERNIQYTEAYAPMTDLLVFFVYLPLNTYHSACQLPQLIRAHLIPVTVLPKIQIDSGCL